MSLFGSKEKSPKKCPGCGTPNQFTHAIDIVTCWSCGEQFATGYEDEIRKRLEKNVSGNPEYKYPRYAVGRAVCYASAIYGMATHDEQFDGTKVENRLRNLSREKEDFRGGATAQSELVQGTQEHRGLRGMTDLRYGYIMVVVNGQQSGQNFQQIYVVFRGSRSDTQESRKGLIFKGALKNPMNAGYTEIDGQTYNIDYAANFTGTYERTPWAPDNLQVKLGFLELYESMRLDVLDNLRQQLGRYPNARVFVTGHSLGAALSVLAAHNIQYHFRDRIAGGGPFCFPFCTPKVGNAAFAFDFQLKLGERKLPIPGEPDPNHLYRRSLNFCESTDPVSNGGTYGFKRDKARSRDTNVNKGPQAAHTGGLLAKAKYGIVKGLPGHVDKKIIFYQTPNLYSLGFFVRIHEYQPVQKFFLGESLYNT